MVNNSGFCLNGLTGLDSNSMEITPEVTFTPSDIPEIPSSPMQEYSINGVNMARYFTSEGIEIGRVINLANTSAQFITAASYRSLLDDPNNTGIIAGFNPMVTGSEENYTDTFFQNPYHYNMINGNDGINLENERITTIINNPTYITFSYLPLDQSYHLGMLTDPEDTLCAIDDDEGHTTTGLANENGEFIALSHLPNTPTNTPPFFTGWENVTNPYLVIGANK